MFEVNQGYTTRLLGGKNAWTYLILYSESCDPASSAPEPFPLMWMTFHLFPTLQDLSSPPPAWFKDFLFSRICIPASTHLCLFMWHFPCQLLCLLLYIILCLFSLISWTVRRNSIIQCNMFLVVFVILTFTLYTSAIISSNLHKYPESCT